MKTSLMEISSSWDGSFAMQTHSITLTLWSLLRAEGSSMHRLTDAQINNHMTVEEPYMLR